MCGEQDHFRKDKINIAPLQISTQTRNIEEVDRLKKLGHFHYRNDITEFFTRKPHEDISYKKILDEAERFANDTSQTCANEDAKAKHICSRGNAVFITGQAGMGKTTLCKLLVSEMLKTEDPLYNAEIVFFIRLRDMKSDKKLHLINFLTSGTLDFDSAKSEVILKYLAEKKVIIVLDGLDEANINDKNKQPESTKLYEKMEVLLTNIIRGNILPQSRKIITSRPRQLARLPEDYHSYFAVNILGLNDEGQKQICTDICQNKSQSDKILGFINERPDLKSYCYVPINAILAMSCFNTIDSKEWDTLDSLTIILATTLNRWFLQKLKGNFQYNEIACLAYDFFVKDQYSFTASDLNNYKINYSNTSTFLTNKIRFELLNCDEVSYFAHLMWQEFFVALYLRLHWSKKLFKKIASKLDTDKFEIVTRFLFGLCNIETFKKLFSYADNNQSESKVAEQKECKKTLKKCTIKTLKKLFATKDKFDDTNSVYFSSILPHLSRVYEMRDPDFAKEVADCLKNKITVQSDHFLPSDIPTLNYVLRRRQREMILNIKNPRFFWNSFEYFFNELKSVLNERKNIQVKNLW